MVLAMVSCVVLRDTSRVSKGTKRNRTFPENGSVAVLMYKDHKARGLLGIQKL